MNEIRAFLLAPIPAALIGGLISWATGAFPRFLSVALFYLLLLYLLQSTIGLAIHYSLRRRRALRVWHCALGGAAMVAVPATPYLAWSMGGQSEMLATGLALLVLWTAFGGLTGAVFWLLAYRAGGAARFRLIWLKRLGLGGGSRPMLATPVQRLAGELMALASRKRAPDLELEDRLWAELAEEANRVLTAVAPGAYCRARKLEKRLDCMIRFSDGRRIGGAVGLRDLTETRLRAIGSQLQRVAVEAAAKLKLANKD